MATIIKAKRKKSDEQRNECKFLHIKYYRISYKNNKDHRILVL